ERPPIGHPREPIERREGLQVRIGFTELLGPFFDEAIELRGAFAQGARPQPENPPRPGQHGGGAENVGGNGLGRKRAELDVDRGTCFVPDAVVVGGRDTEAVTARQKVRVVRRATPFGVDPVAIEAFEPETYAVALGHGQAERGKSYLEPLVARSY